MNTKVGKNAVELFLVEDNPTDAKSHPQDLKGKRGGG